MGATQMCFFHSGYSYSERMIDLPNPNRCSLFCGDRQCLLTCTVHRVTIWRRSRGAGAAPLGSRRSAICVEVEPQGVRGQTKCTEAGLREVLPAEERLSADAYREAWVWGPGVPTSTQLELSVLESQDSSWWPSGPAQASRWTPLGRARLQAYKDFRRAGPSKEPHPVTHGLGELRLPLVLDGCVCGQVEVGVSLHCEDLCLELSNFSKEVGLPPAGYCGRVEESCVLAPLASSICRPAWAAEPSPEVVTAGPGALGRPSWDVEGLLLGSCEDHVTTPATMLPPLSCVEEDPASPHAKLTDALTRPPALCGGAACADIVCGTTFSW